MEKTGLVSEESIQPLSTNLAQVNNSKNEMKVIANPFSAIRGSFKQIWHIRAHIQAEVEPKSIV